MSTFMACNDYKTAWFLCRLAKVTYDGDKESEGEEDGASPEDSRKVSLRFFS